MEFKIAVLPGDGVGPDVTREAVRVLEEIGKAFGHTFHFEERLVGGCCIETYGMPIQPETVELCRNSDAILFGAVGGPKWDILPRNQCAVAGLSTLRHAFNLFCNLRPVKVFDELKGNSPLKERVLADGVDMMMIRDLTGGIYYNEKGTREGKYGIERYDVECYSAFEVERVARRAFEIARNRRKKVTSVDKSNALESSRMWRETMNKVHEDYPDVALNHILVDRAAMDLACDPCGFDVMVTTSIFGDILSDEAGVLTGSLGLLPSAAINEHNFGLFEPAHGPAQDIAGMGISNPLAAILAAKMLIDVALNLPEEAAAIDRAIAETLAAGYRTADIYTGAEGEIKCNTEEMGKQVAARVRK